MAGLIASALVGGLTGAAEAGGKAMFEQMKSDMEEQKAIRIAEAAETRKTQSAQLERENIGGIISGARQAGQSALNQFGPNTSESLEMAGSRSAQQALQDVGYLDEAKALNAAYNQDITTKIQQQNAETNRLNVTNKASEEAARIAIAEAAEARAVVAFTDESKVPKAVQLSYAPIQKEMDVIAGAIAKSQADGSWNAEGAGAKELVARQSLLSKRALKMLSPYMGGAKGEAKKDALGFYSDRKPGVPSTLTDANSGGQGRSSASATRNTLLQEMEVAIGAKDKKAIAQITKDLESLDISDANPPKSPEKAAGPSRAKPQEKGLIATSMGDVGNYLSGMGVDYSTPQGKAALQRRVIEASKGGVQLTRAERTRAEQAGLIE